MNIDPDQMRDQQRDAEDLETENQRRAAIPTPRWAAFSKQPGVTFGEWMAFTKELERDLHDMAQSHVHRDMARSVATQMLTALREPEKITKRMDIFESVHQWQRRAVSIVLAKLDVAELPAQRGEVLTPQQQIEALTGCRDHWKIW